MHSPHRPELLLRLPNGGDNQKEINQVQLNEGKGGRILVAGRGPCRSRKAVLLQEKIIQQHLLTSNQSAINYLDCQTYLFVDIHILNQANHF